MEKPIDNSPWPKYNEAVIAPRLLCQEGISHVTSKNRALDFGSGSLTDTVFMLDSGFAHIDSIDASDDSKQRATALNDKRVSHSQTTFEDFHPEKDTYDLVSAQNTLPFIAAESFDNKIAELIASLKSDGIFAANFFGDRDDWNNPASGNTCITKEQVEKLFEGMEIITFREIENDDGTALGKPKHWHFFNVIARKT